MSSNRNGRRARFEYPDERGWVRAEGSMWPARALWVAGFCVLLLMTCPCQSRAESAETYEGERATPQSQPAVSPGPFKTFLGELQDGFSFRGNVLGFGFVQHPVESDLNRNNHLDLAQYQTEWDFRPDFDLKFRRLDLSVKPRFNIYWQKLPAKKGEHTSLFNEELYVNEWLVRFRAADELFASYGRENLQWGPSYLLSPSNPFNPQNGQNNPFLEVPGMDYGRLVWIPNETWSVSYIVNTNAGRNNLIKDFQITYAAKIDYTGHNKYFSIIPFVRQSGEFGSGFFGGWNVTDAIMLHSEAFLSTDRGNFKILTGASYTFRLGPTLVLEYFYQKNGCDFESIGRCFVRSAGGDAVAADVLVRQHYLLFQYIEPKILNDLDVSFRFIHNFDNNNSNTFIGVADYELLDWVELFSVTTVNMGVNNSEFASLVTYQVEAGLKFSF